jgi:hypothetical protein
MARRSSRTRSRSRKQEKEYDSEIWRPEEKGDEIYGEISAMYESNTRFGETPTVVLEDEDGEKWTIFCGSVLANELYDEGEVGDWVTITFKGKERGEFGKNKFDVEFD